MEQDYNLKKWSKGCPNTGVNCRRSSCGIEYVFIPAALGDDQEGSPVAPKNGSYNNAIVYYEATGNVYLYSSDGVPTRVEKNLDSIIAELQKELNDVEEALSEETTAREAADAALDGRIDTVADNLATETANRISADEDLQADIATETTARQNADTALQNNITAEATNRANADSALQTNINTVSGNLSAEITARQNADTALGNRITAIEEKIPAQASAQNQLADKGFVNSSVATNTANYISNNGQPFNSLAELEAYSGTLTNNDYAFVVGTDQAGNTTYTRYKYVASTDSWAEEYVLNNSSFTAVQWATINSGITSGDVSKLNNLANIQTIGTNLALTNGELSATDTTYTAGTGLDLTGTQFSIDNATVATQSDLAAGLAGKQDTLTAGANITIDANNVISATGGGGASTLTITVTYSQQEADEFTWSGATINEIESAYNSGTEIYIPTRYMGTVKVTSLSGDSQELYMTALYTGYQTCTFLLKSDGTGEVYWYELAQEQTLQDVEDSLSTRINNKQDKLTAGSNITISGNTISATNTTYTAGNNITISNGTISATDTTYTAGTGLSLTGTQFSIDNTVALKSEIPTNNNQLTNGAGYLTRNDYATSTTAGVIITNPQYGASTSSYTQNITATTKTYAQYQNADNATFVGKGTLENVIAGKGLVDQTALATKQDVLTAGTGISITNGVISCTFANGNGVSY